VLELRLSWFLEKLTGTSGALFHFIRLHYSSSTSTDCSSVIVHCAALASVSQFCPKIQTFSSCHARTFHSTLSSGLEAGIATKYNTKSKTKDISMHSPAFLGPISFVSFDLQHGLHCRLYSAHSAATVMKVALDDTVSMVANPLAIKTEFFELFFLKSFFAK
jgi:hypothetical protein